MTSLLRVLSYVKSYWRLAILVDSVLGDKPLPGVVDSLDALLQQDGLYRQLHDLQPRSSERRSRQTLSPVPSAVGRSA